MKSLDELIARSKRIPKLAVSEELLCARAEGRLSPTEARMVDSAVSQDRRLQNLVNDVERYRSTYMALFDDLISTDDKDDKSKKKSKR